MRKALGLETRILRWSKSKRARVIRDHANDRSVIDNIEEHLRRWSVAGVERKSPTTYRVLFRHEGRWYSASIGQDREGSTNMLTVFGSSAAGFYQRRLQGMENVVRKR